MSAAISFVSDDVAVLASDSARTVWDEDSGEIFGRWNDMKLRFVEGGAVSGTGSGGSFKNVIDAIVECGVSGDLDDVGDLVDEECNRTGQDAHIVQVFGGDGELGTLDYDTRGNGDRLTRYGASLLAGPPAEMEMTMDVMRQIQRHAMEEANESSDMGGIMDALRLCIRRLAHRSRWIGLPTQIGVVNRQGEAVAYQLGDRRYVFEGRQPVEGRQPGQVRV